MNQAILLFPAFFACLLRSVSTAPDNAGTEFIIGYMENIGGSMDVELFVTTMRTSIVNVNVTAPGYSSAGINESFNVTSGVVKQLLFPSSIRMSGTTKDPKAVLVTSDDEVVIYGVNKATYSCDAFLGLPIDVLGMLYYATTFYPATKQCEILIAAVYDNTMVTVQLGPYLGYKNVYYSGTFYYSGETFSLSMNRYDVFQFFSTGDLSGTKVSADKNIAVFSGNKKTSIGSGATSDHLVEQLTRVDSWGKTFITVPVPHRTVGDYFRFIASENNTTVTISGGFSDTFTLSNAGDMVQKDIPSTAYCWLVSDKPILVVQFCLSQQSNTEQSDPMMMIIPPVEQYAADYTFATPKYSMGGSYSNYFMFVVKDAEKAGLRLDGASFNSPTYNAVNGTNYVAGFISVSEGSHTVRHTSPIAIFGGYLYGQAMYETYGFTTGMRMAPINTVCVPSTTVVGDGFDNDCDGLIDEEMCNAPNNGTDDDADGVIDEDCAKPPPVDGNWTGWSGFGPCSITCRDNGTAPTGVQTRNRTCTNPSPAYDGQQCVGLDTDTSSCSPSNYCPFDGSWGPWGQYGTCPVTCGNGSQSRTRSCDSPAPVNGGQQCVGSSGDSQACNSTDCPTTTQSCPPGWFGCQTVPVICIEDSLKCDCDPDCSDASDETEAHAGCLPASIQTCIRLRSGSAKVVSQLPTVLLLGCIFVTRKLSS